MSIIKEVNMKFKDWIETKYIEYSITLCYMQVKFWRLFNK